MRISTLGMAATLSVGANLLVPATANNLSQEERDACLANGISERQCLCVFAEVRKRHGGDAARLVALDMALQYEQAEALRNQVGEEAAFAASDTFETAQYTSCSNNRLDRLEGKSPAAASTNAVSSSMSAESATLEPENNGVAMTAAVLTRGEDGGFYLDLQNYPDGGVLELMINIDDRFTKKLRSTNIGNFVGFYPIADAMGGIDKDGNGEADTYPGDEDFVNAVQIYSLSRKFNFSDSMGSDYILGDVTLEGGVKYAPYMRVDFGSRRSGFNLFGLSKSTGSTEDMMKALSTPMHLYFTNSAANPDNVNHLDMLGDTRIGFAGTGLSGDKTTADIELEVTFYPAR